MLLIYCQQRICIYWSMWKHSVLCLAFWPSFLFTSLLNLSPDRLLMARWHSVNWLICFLVRPFRYWIFGHGLSLKWSNSTFSGWKTRIPKRCLHRIWFCCIVASTDRASQTLHLFGGKRKSSHFMFQAVVAIGIIVMSLAAVWSISKAISLVLRNQVREGIPYLLAFFLLIFFDFYLMRLLPWG